MPRRLDSEDDWDDEDEFAEEPEDEPTVACPYCRREIHEDAPRCPHCERYISDADRPGRRKSWLMIVGVILCLYAVYHWIVG